MNGDLSTVHTASRGGTPLLIDQTTGTAYTPAEVSCVSSGPEQEKSLRDAGYEVVEHAKLQQLAADFKTFCAESRESP